MKMIAIALMSLMTQAAVAGNGIERHEIDFTGAAELSADAKLKVTQLLNKRCQPAASSAASVKVHVANVQVDSPDQGIQDLTYDMAISLSGANDVILLTLKEWQISNPAIDKFEVIKLVSKKSCR